VDTGGTCRAGKIRLPVYPANGQSESERSPPETVSLPLLTHVCLLGGYLRFPVRRVLRFQEREEGTSIPLATEPVFRV
jgi:hypothetical protein